MKGTVIFFVVLIAATYVISDFNHRVGPNPLTIVINTTFLLSVIYLSSMVSVKDIQKLFDKQKKKDKNIFITDGDN